MIKHLLLAASLLFSCFGAVAQIHEQDGDSIVPFGDEKYKTGVYYRVTSLSYRMASLAGFISGQERSEIDVPKEFYDSISGESYTVTSVADDAFKGQTILKKVTLPPSVTRIGKSAFEGTSIEDAVIPGSTYHVMESAYATPTLKRVYIYAPGEEGAPLTPDHSIELQHNAFGVADGGNLTGVYVNYKKPPVVTDGLTPFPQVATHHSSAKLHLTADTNEDDYRTPYCWKDFYTVDPAAIDSVEIDGNDAPAEYFNIQGQKVNASALIPGIYIVRRGAKVTKAVIH